MNNEPWLWLTPGGLGYLPLLLQCIDCCSALQGRYSPGELMQILGIQNPELGVGGPHGLSSQPRLPPYDTLLPVPCFPGTLSPESGLMS